MSFVGAPPQHPAAKLGDRPNPMSITANGSFQNGGTQYKHPKCFIILIKLPKKVPLLV